MTVSKSRTQVSKTQRSKPAEQPIYFAGQTGPMFFTTTQSWRGETLRGQLVTHEQRADSKTGAVSCTCHNHQNARIEAAKVADVTPTIHTSEFQCKHLVEAIGCLVEWGCLTVGMASAEIEALEEEAESKSAEFDYYAFFEGL